MKILGTGLSGLVGSRIVEVLQGRAEFEHSEVDVADEASIKKKIESSDASIVLHLAAKANVDACEDDESLQGEGQTWKINVLGTKNIAEACQAHSKKLVYISTDFVFNGENPPYSEDSIPSPINWYGKTKYEGEKVAENVQNFIIARISYPYRSKFERNDFARAFIEKLKSGQEVNAVVDHKFNPTFIDDIAEALFALIEKNQTGIFHVVGSKPISPFDAANLIADKFGFDKTLIKQTTRKEFFKNRAQRPFRLELLNDKITGLGIKMRTFEEGLNEL